MTETHRSPQCISIYNTQRRAESLYSPYYMHLVTRPALRGPVCQRASRMLTVLHHIASHCIFRIPHTVMHLIKNIPVSMYVYAQAKNTCSHNNMLHSCKNYIN